MQRVERAFPRQQSQATNAKKIGGNTINIHSATCNVLQCNSVAQQVARITAHLHFTFEDLLIFFPRTRFWNV